MFTIFALSALLLSPDLTGSRFDEVVSQVADIYHPIALQAGKDLQVTSDWSHDLIPGSSFFGGTYYVHMNAAQIRPLPQFTEDAVRLILCHELGHVFGALPEKPHKEGRISAEGQADYYSTLKCLRLVFAKDDNIAIASHLTLPESVESKCQGSFKDQGASAICLRSAAAALMAVQTFGGKVRPSVDTPDQTQVPETEEEATGAQCRLDTLLAGAYCNISKDEVLNRDKPLGGACNESQGNALGRRPGCWFKEGSYLKAY